MNTERGNLMGDETKAEPQGDGLRGLLERWSSVEPERCVVGIGGVFCLTLRGEQALANRWPDTSTYLPENILAAVMEAIKARVLSPWTLSHDENGYSAQLSNYRDGIRFSVFGPESRSPAAALLSAYVAALEAEGTP